MGDAGGGVEEKHQYGVVNAVLLIMNAEAGAGILNFPEAFMLGGGVLWSMILQGTFLLFSIWGMMAMNLTAIKHHVETLGELMMVTGGKVLSVICSAIIVVYALGSLSAYLVVVGDNWDSVFHAVGGIDFCDHWYMNRKFTIPVSSALLVLPNCFPKKVGWLRHVSKIGIFGIIYVLFLVIIYHFIGGFTQGPIRHYPESTLEFLSCLPTFCYAYHCHVQSVPVFYCMRNPNVRRLLIAAVSANALCCFFFSLAGVCGYLTFGDDVYSNIISCYPARNVFVIFALIFVVIKICCSYPVVLFVGRKEIIDLHNMTWNQDPEHRELLKRVCYALLYYLLSLFFSLFIPNIGLAISFTGVLIAFFIFVFPGTSQYLHARKNPEEPNRSLNYLSGISLMVVGLLMSCGAFGLSLRRALTSKRNFRQLCHSKNL